MKPLVLTRGLFVVKRIQPVKPVVLKALAMERTSDYIIKVKVCQPNEKIKGGIVMTKDDINIILFKKQIQQFMIQRV